MSLLEVRGLQACYGAVRVLHGLDFDVDEGEIVVLLGANGAGKTTTLRAISQMDLVDVGGDIIFGGKRIMSQHPEAVVRAGIAHVPQGRGTFPELTVRENLIAGAYIRSDGEIDADIDFWYGVFPRLAERRNQPAGQRSGGEQQMLAIARALMSRPRLLLLDEPSLGLAPIVIKNLFATFAELNRDRQTTMLIVEQNAGIALELAHRAYVLEAGSIVLQGLAADLQGHDAVRQAYLGY
jgi:branched-chain amino acid transport system ATP-binding protein